MGRIQVLSQNTINQIAAGEVIERPASVVKELVENAIDAKASAVTVEIKEGGIDFIRVTDNGTGIEKEDVKTAFLCHATSKIRTTDDLLSIGSLGFRGEALASIASVSKTELITKTAEPMTGVRYVIEGGEEKECDEVGCPEGTTFIVRNLFYNTPARRKFLKSKMTEASYISTMMERIALSHPEVSIKLIHQNKAIIATSGSGRLKDVIYQIYGKDIANNLIPVEVKTANFTIGGFVGKPAVSRGNRALENYFVNGRYIKNNIITKAIEDSYKTWQMVHKYPFTALNLQIEPDLLDVNVHPTKMEVRFKNGEELFSAFFEGIREALSSHQHVRKVTLDKKMPQIQEHAKPVARGAEPFEKSRMPLPRPVEGTEKSRMPLRKTPMREVKPMEEMLKEESRYEVDRIFQKQESKGKEELSATKEVVVEKSQSNPEPEMAENKEKSTAVPAESKPQQEAQETEKGVPTQEVQKAKKTEEAVMQLSFLEEDIHTEDTKEDTRIIGQLFDTYWMLQKGQELLIMDQHAAHEKVLYEKLLKSYREQTIYKQQLMPPVILNLTLKELDFVKNCEKLLEELGFTLEEFGSDAYCLRTIPSNLFGMDAQVFFRELLDNMEEEVKKTDMEMVLDKIATMACKAAIKANHKMTMTEARELLKECEKLENPYTCPHGRPILISISKREIEKKFKRIV